MSYLTCNNNRKVKVTWCAKNRFYFIIFDTLKYFLEELAGTWHIRCFCARRVVVFTQGRRAIICTVRLDPAGNARLLHVSSHYLSRRDRGKWLRDVNVVIHYN